MIIETVDFSNFRNYQELHLSLGPGTHIFFGDNAQGKTNILEGIYLSAANKSHRGAKDKEMIRFGEEEAHLKITATKNELPYRVDLHLKKAGNKGIAVNGVTVRKAKDFLGTLLVVLFSPEDLQIVKNGPAERRRFIDTELCQIDKVYSNSFIQYKKALEERNQLLKDLPFDPSLQETMDLWDAQLLKYGKEIIRRRESFIGELQKITKEIHGRLSGGREKLDIFYEPDVKEEDFDKKLKTERSRDLKAKTTTVGPHRDDISFMITSGTEKEENIDARIYGSQGQQRTCALTLKMAEIELIRQKFGEYPTLLLDDVLSELDSNRQQFLLDSIKEIQTIITCTGLDDFVQHQFEMHRVYHVVNGEVKNDRE